VFGSKPEIRIREEDLQTIRQPVLLIWGSNDTFGTVEEGQKIASCIKDSRFINLESAGHLPWLDEPPFCAERIIEFLSN